MKKPVGVYFIILIVLFVSISAIFGGFSLIKDPTGNLIQFPNNYLKNTFFGNYLIPGLILFLVLGIFPLFLVYGLIKKDSLKFLEFFNIYNDLRWQFSFTIYYGIVLIIWIDVQIMLVPYIILQPIISGIGIIILALSLSKEFRRYYLK